MLKNEEDTAKLERLQATEVVIDPAEKAATEKTFANYLKEYRKRKRIVTAPLFVPPHLAGQGHVGQHHGRVSQEDETTVRRDRH